MHYQPDYNAIHTYYDVSDRAGKLADMPLDELRNAYEKSLLLGANNDSPYQALSNTRGAMISAIILNEFQAAFAEFDLTIRRYKPLGW